METTNREHIRYSRPAHARGRISPGPHELLMSTRRRFQQVDVFTATPYAGNPVAVVLDGEGVTTEDMQRFTRWTNLSEATFVLPPTETGADYRVRIFTSASATPA